MDLNILEDHLYLIPDTLNSSEESINAQKILVFVNKKDYEDHSSLLEKIMGAIKLDFNKDIKVISLEETESKAASFFDSNELNYVMAFGLRPARIGMNAKFKANHFYQTESFKVMLTYKLEQLTSDVSKKKALWGALQSEFIKK